MQLSSIFVEKYSGIYSDEDKVGLTGIATEELSIRPKEIVCLVKDGHIDAAEFRISMCQSLVNTCYESVKSKNNQSPEFEFFRHIRNACSHNKLFKPARQYN
jgi:hypothetical protein